MAEDVDVSDADDAQRFEARIGGVLAGFVTYERDDAVVTYLHTTVLAPFEGRGIGGALARAVLNDARGRGLTVRPTCPFIARWISRHPEYADLV